MHVLLTGAAGFIGHRLARAGRLLPVFGDGRPRGFTGNVAGPELVTTDELARAVGEALGRPVEIDHGRSVPGDVARTAADTTIVRERLGWEPRTCLAEGLAAQVSHEEAA